MVPCGKGNPAATDQDSRAADVVNPRDVAPDEPTPTESKQISPNDVPPIKQPCNALVLFTEPRGDGPNGQPGAASGTQPQSEQGGSNSFTTPEKLLLTSAKVTHGFPQGQEGGTGTPPTKGEKPSEDGFNWRKYGQKNVRGNEFVRSYYKCTHPNCSVKKQVERSLEGLITDTVYFGQHDHPKPQTSAPMALCVVERKPSSIATEEKSLDGSGQTGERVKAVEAAPLQVVTAEDDVKCVASPRSRVREGISNDDDPASKKKKKDNRSVDVVSPDKPSGEARHIVQTTSEVDIVNDGYRWRKYGQKLVKGNPHPRSYYRCSSPGCPVKKHVERAHHDPKLVMTSYEGQHDHDVPAAVRTVIRNPLGSGSNDDARTIKSEEHEPKEEEKTALVAETPVTRIPLASESNGDAKIKSDEPEPKEEEKPAAPSEEHAARIGTVGNEKQQSVLNAAAVQS